METLFLLEGLDIAMQLNTIMSAELAGISILERLTMMMEEISGQCHNLTGDKMGSGKSVNWNNESADPDQCDMCGGFREGYCDKCICDLCHCEKCKEERKRIKGVTAHFASEIKSKTICGQNSVKVITTANPKLVSCGHCWNKLN